MIRQSVLVLNKTEQNKTSGDAIRNTKVKPKDSMALSGKTNRNIYTDLGNAEDSGTHLKYLYTNVCSMRNKGDKLEALVLSWSYDITHIS